MKVYDIIKFRGYGNKTTKNLDCSRLNITSLEGSPQEIGGDFNCFLNNLKTLKHSPKIVNGNFNCSSNKLETILGCPEFVNGSFNCERNKITSLEGSPKYVGGNYICSSNKLKTLEGITKNIGGYLYINNNKELENIKNQIIKYQIKAKEYITDEGVFNFKEIEIEFLEYAKNEEIKKINKEKINKIDFGLSI